MSKIKTVVILAMAISANANAFDIFEGTFLSDDWEPGVSSSMFNDDSNQPKTYRSRSNGRYAGSDGSTLRTRSNNRLVDSDSGVTYRNRGNGRLTGSDGSTCRARSGGRIVCN